MDRVTQPDKTRTTRTPAFWGYPPPPHDYPYHWVILDPKSKEDKVKVTNLKKSPKFQIFEFWNGHYTRQTFWSCLIRCANMKWIPWVFLKIQSGHDSVHRRTDGQTDGRTDGQTDRVIPVYPPINFVEAGGITMCPQTTIQHQDDVNAYLPWLELPQSGVKLSTFITIHCFVQVDYQMCIS